MPRPPGLVLLCWFLLVIFSGDLPAVERPLAPAKAPDLEVFVREGCPHCAHAKVFLAALQQERPTLQVAVHDLAYDPTQLARLTRLAREQGLSPVGVPAFLIDDTLLIGFRDETSTGQQIRRLLDMRLGARSPDAPPPDLVTSWFGTLEAGRLGLPLFTLALGLLDGFNPCAMWVLLFLLSLLVHVPERRTMVLIAGTFVVASGLVYFAFMAAWLNLFLFIGAARPLELLLGVVALLIGGVHVKDFLTAGTGWSLSIPDSAKPGLYARMRRIVQSRHPGEALAAVTVLAVIVNIVELLCTAGVPAVYTRVLTWYALPTWQYYGYLGLYNLAYVADDALMVVLAVTALTRHRLQAREGRWLKLVSGVVMALLGLVLLVKPEWLH